LKRSLPVLAGLAVLVGTGVVHGLWTDRWRHSAELEEAAERLALLPDDVGPWRGRLAELDPAELAGAGAVGHWARYLTDPASGETVLVLLLCGRPGRMSVHRPEHCYRAAGYEMAGDPLHVQVRPHGVPAGDGGAEFFTALFARSTESGPETLRIFWSWLSAGEWKAPDHPRLEFARQRALYKLYLIRTVTGPASSLEADPCVELLGRLLPVLHRTLAPDR
jgi:hypothetical protein